MTTRNAVLLIASLTCACNKVERIPGEQRVFVEEVLPASRQAVTSAVTRAFDRQAIRSGNTQPTWLRNCLLHAFQRRRLTGMGTPGRDEALQRYLSLPDDRTTGDFLLDCQMGEFWESEYRSRWGKPLPFNATFIIHLDPVEIIEYSAYVIAGKTIGITHGPMLVYDIRQVPATTRDRIAVLSRIREALR